jgi:hypothetical protein
MDRHRMKRFLQARYGNYIRGQLIEHMEARQIMAIYFRITEAEKGTRNNGRKRKRRAGKARG